MKVKRHIGLPEGEMAIIPDEDTLIHNIITPELEEKDKEIDRLNNIIEELEKWLNEEKQKFLNSENVIFSNVEDLTLTSVINKLKELKEGK